MEPHPGTTVILTDGTVAILAVDEHDVIVRTADGARCAPLWPPSPRSARPRGRGRPVAS